MRHKKKNIAVDLDIPTIELQPVEIILKMPYQPLDSHYNVGNHSAVIQTAEITETNRFLKLKPFLHLDELNDQETQHTFTS